jgi:L-malate glycosyltransferase
VYIKTTGTQKVCCAYDLPSRKHLFYITRLAPNNNINTKLRLDLKTKIFSPVVSGTGVEVIHKSLSKHIENYTYSPVNPTKGMLPILLKKYRGDADIIHTIPDMGPSLFGINQKNIITFHGFSTDEQFIRTQPDWKRRLYYRHFLRKKISASLEKATAVTVVSNFLAEIVQRETGYSKQIHIIHNGVNVKQFHPNKSKNDNEIVRVLFAGKLINRKGFDTILALAQLFEGKIEFWAVGSGSKRHTSNNLLTIIPAVSHEEMPNLYQQVDALLFPSLREGFGLVIAEAMASGLPVISSNTSAIPELIVDGKGGYLCDFGDTAQLLEALTRLSKSKSNRSEFGEFNRERAIKLFDEADMIKSYNHLFNNI